MYIGPGAGLPFFGHSLTLHTRYRSLSSLSTWPFRMLWLIVTGEKRLSQREGEEGDLPWAGWIRSEVSRAIHGGRQACRI